MNPAAEGYHTGSPWNGDIEKAPVLFLGSNPGFTPRSFAPRLHMLDGETFYTFEPDNAGAKATRYSLDDVKIFCRDIFQSDDYSPIDSKLSFSVSVIARNGTKKPKNNGVPYWNVGYRFAEKLLEMDKGYSDNAILTDRKRHMRDVMKNVVFMEVVPFASKSDGVLSDALLDWCWQNFTEKILPLAAAPVVVLVGNRARDTFLRNIPDGDGANALDAFKSGGIYGHKFGRADKKVVAVEHFSGRRGWLLPENYFSGGVLTALRGAMAGMIHR
jgi:hypothetical protein